MKRLLLIASHLVALVIGFAAGIYVLPILIAPEAPSHTQLGQRAGEALFTGRFSRDLKGSDALHWGEGTLHVGPRAIALEGRLAPGPDYRLYLSPEFVDTEADFLRLKARMAHVGHVRTFDNFVVDLPPGIEPAQYTTAIVWCETFGQFIIAAQYR